MVCDVALPTSQLILQSFRCFTYVTAHSLTLLSLLLHHMLFTYVTWQAAHEMYGWWVWEFLFSQVHGTMKCAVRLAGETGYLLMVIMTPVELNFSITCNYYAWPFLRNKTTCLYLLFFCHGQICYNVHLWVHLLSREILQLEHFIKNISYSPNSVKLFWRRKL